MRVTATEAPPAIRRIDTSRADLCALEIVGRLTTADVENAYGIVEAEFASHDRIDLLVKVSDYEGFDWASAFNLDILRRKMRAIGHIGHYALVGGPGWLHMLTRGSALFLSMEIRCYQAAEEVEAWKWLKARPLERG